jgi:hypothetical protein
VRLCKGCHRPTADRRGTCNACRSAVDYFDLSLRNQIATISKWVGKIHKEYRKRKKGERVPEPEQPPHTPTSADYVPLKLFDSSND